MLKNLLATCVIVLLLAATGLHAQNVFVLPGSNSVSQNISVFTANPFSNVTGFSAGAGSFQVIAKPDGSKFYVIANSGSATVTMVPNNFSNPKSLGNIGQQATAAAISEDGRRLIVANGLVHIYETTGDTDLLPSGLSVGPVVTVFDVAASLDGKSFYTLGLNSAGGSVLNSIDASSSVVSGTLPIQGIATALSVGPNGLIYVSTQNQILEVNPSTLTVTPGGPILVNAKPGRLAFTPDGRYALAANLTPVTGSALLLIGLSSHAVVNTVSNFGVILDQLLVLNSTNVLAYSAQNQSLYQITLSSTGNLGINGFSLPGITTSNATSAAVFSNEVPIAGRTTPQYLYAVVNGIIYREDLTSNQINGQFPVSFTPGALSYAGAATAGTLPTTLLQYGNNQTVAASAGSLPIVVRVLDNLGNPLNGIGVTFGTNASGASLSATSATTGTNGYAVTYLTAPSTSGPVVVTATAGSQSVAFNLTVGTTSGGSSGNLSIVAGQGQIVFENNNTGIPGFGSPLVVQVNDGNGRPVIGASVTYTVTQGLGTVTALGATPCSQLNCIVVTTDNNGQATANFLSTAIGQNGTGFVSTTVTASAPNTNSVNFYVTTTPQGSPAQVRLLQPNPGDTLIGQAGATLPGAVIVRATSVTGLSIPNVSLRIGGSPDPNQFPSASCNDATGQPILTDATGTATCDLVLNGKVGKATLFASVGYFQNTPNFNVQITSGPPGAVKIIQGNNQSGLPGQRLPLALLVQVSDSFGNILTGVPVTWSVVTPGTVTLSNIFNITDVNGNASALATLGNIAGNVQVRVTAGNFFATFTLTVNIPSTGIQRISGDGQTTLINTAFQSPVVVKVVDANNNGVRGVQVNFQVTSGSGSVVSPTVTTDANGQASTIVNAGSSAGTIVVTASSSSFSVTFTLTSRLPGPTNVTFVNGASFLPFISPGAIVTISGNGIAPGVQGLVTAFSIIGPLPTSLAGVSVTFNGVLAPIYFVQTAAGRPDQVTVQVPFETPPGTVNVVINAAGGGNATVTAQVQVLAPGIFEAVSGNQKIAVALRPDGSYVSPSNPARRGEVIRVYVTGLGQVSPATATNNAGVPGQSVTAALIVGLNNGGVPLVSAEYAPGLVGVYVVALLVPSDTQTGSAQPVGVIAYDSANNAYFAQGSNIAIQ